MASITISTTSTNKVEVSTTEAPSVSVKNADVSKITVQGYALSTAATQGDPGPGVIDGGEEYQILEKNSGTDQDMRWAWPDHQIFKVKNTDEDSSDLSAGDPVYAMGEVGSSGVIKIGKAKANDASKMPAIGLLMEDITHNSQGLLLSSGIFHPNLNVGFAAEAGDTLYVHATGGLTATKPSGDGNLIQNIGTVLQGNNNNQIQEIKVSSIDRTNDVPNLPSGKIFMGAPTGYTVTSEYSFPTVGSANKFLQFNAEGSALNAVSAPQGSTDLSVTQTSASDVQINSSTGQNATIVRASQTIAGAMSAADKTKLDGIADNAEVNVNADWSSSSGDSEILNKPTIPASLTDLSDAAVSGVSGGQILISGNSGVFRNTNLTAGDNITVTEGDGTLEVSAAFGGDLGELGDVTVTSAAANQYVVRNSGNTEFINQALDISHDTSPTLGGHLNIGGFELRSTSDGDINIKPNGTGNVELGNFVFDTDQSVGAGQDNYVLTYDNSSGHISLEEASGGVASGNNAADTYVAFFTDSGSTIDGDGGLVFNSSANRLTTNEIDVLRIRMNDSTTQLTAAGKTGYGARVATLGNITTGLTPGTLIHLNGNWDEADSDNLADSTGLLAVAAGQSSAYAVMSGPVRMADASLFSGSGVASGDPLFVAGGAAAGKVTATRPSGASEIIRIVGYVIDKTNAIIYFNPSNDWIQLNA